MTSDNARELQKEMDELRKQNSNLSALMKNERNKYESLKQLEEKIKIYKNRFSSATIPNTQFILQMKINGKKNPL